LIGRIQSANYLFFTKDEFDSKGTSHKKPLYIIGKCKDYVIAKVFIDNDSILNVLPRYVPDKMHMDAFQ
jgi:hypothetical protein